MYLNGYSVRVVGGQEVAGGYVEIQHDKQYKLSLRNANDVRCDAKVMIDGNHVGTWRIGANSNVLIERPVHDNGRFTAYLKDSKEGRTVGLKDGNPSLGLISVEFLPEVKVTYTYTPGRTVYVYPHYVWPSGPYPQREPYYWGSYYQTICDNSTFDMNITCNTSLESYSDESGAVLFTSRSDPPRAMQVSEKSKEMGTGLSGHSHQSFREVGSLNYDYARMTTINLRLVEHRHDNEGPRPLMQNATTVPPRVR
jgi:hypothetical protein